MFFKRFSSKSFGLGKESIATLSNVTDVMPVKSYLKHQQETVQNACASLQNKDKMLKAQLNSLDKVAAVVKNHAASPEARSRPCTSRSLIKRAGIT